MSDYRTAYPDRYSLLKAFARANRANPTLAEQVLWQHLRDDQLGIKFLRQHIIGDYIVDFVSREQGLVIEVDGAYHTEPQQQADDELREAALQRMGYPSYASPTRKYYTILNQLSTKFRTTLNEILHSIISISCPHSTLPLEGE